MIQLREFLAEKIKYVPDDRLQDIIDFIDFIHWKKEKKYLTCFRFQVHYNSSAFSQSAVNAEIRDL